LTSYEQLSTFGMTLRSYPFRDTSKILKVYTREHGLISLLIKGLSSKNTQKTSLCSSFTLAEFNFKKGKNDLHYFTESKILDLHLSFRESLSRIQAGMKICQTLLEMQEPEKKNELLFSLLVRFIKKMENTSYPRNYLHSFRLKALSLEGMINLSSCCTQCKNPAFYIDFGECFCKKHTPCGAVSFSTEELAALFSLNYTKSFMEIEQVKLTSELEDKIERLYQTMLKH